MHVTKAQFETEGARRYLVQAHARVLVGELDRGLLARFTRGPSQVA